MKRRRYSLPSDPSNFDYDDPKLRRASYPLLVVLVIPPVLGCVWRGFVLGDAIGGFLGLIVCPAFAWIVWHDLVTRTTKPHGRTFYRYEQPVRYWFSLAVWIAFYIMMVVALFSKHTRGSGAMHG